MKEISRLGGHFDSGIRARAGFAGNVNPFGKWRMVCRRNGGIIWEVEWENLVVNSGRDYLVDVGLSGGTQITTWYIGLVNGATPTFAAADTMASHGGWTESTAYDEANRPTFVEAGVSGGQVTNTASKATFTMNATATIGGAFLVSNNTKGGTTGTLYAEGDFATDRSVIDNDVLEVTATFGAADDGV